MTDAELKSTLDQLRTLPAETEWFEFKHAANTFDFRELGKYFSALANEANLKDRSAGWLVFGVENKTGNILGSSFRSNRPDLDNLKREIAQQTSNGHTFRDVHELRLPEGRVVMFEIPPAPRGLPVAFKGHWYGRDGESLVALSLEEVERIRNQSSQTDWSAEICPNATLNDLAPDALAKARDQFKRKNPERAGDIDTWDDKTFLDRAKININGQITRAAILLLGQSHATHHLNPAPARITWKLTGDEEAYEHFDPPFLLNTNALFQRVRNVKFKLQPFNQLIPIELTKYDAKVVLEALNNCIAHQDYTRNARINVTETTESLTFENEGGFFEGTLEDYVLQNRMPSRHRNQFLAQAMVNLDMIDTMGFGIKRMYQTQRERYFPLPDYDLSDPNQVRLRLMGKLIDENYSRILIADADLDLSTVIALDKVQKRQPVTKEQRQALRKQRLIEGRSPNIYVASKIAELIGDKAQYIRNRAFDNDHYKELIRSFIKEYGMATRADIDSLLMDKLSDALTPTQKKNKIGNLLGAMARKDGEIFNRGSDRKPEWILVDSGNNL